MPDKPPPDHILVSDSNLRPEDLFNTYFYGDFLHVGDDAGKLVDINSTTATRHTTCSGVVDQPVGCGGRPGCRTRSVGGPPGQRHLVAFFATRCCTYHITQLA
jgi:hypothetical protein